MERKSDYILETREFLNDWNEIMILTQDALKKMKEVRKDIQVGYELPEGIVRKRFDGEVKK